MDELYQSQILALARLARTSTDIAQPTHHARVKNPLCGDEVVLRLSVQSDQIAAVHVSVKGCALCEAGAGLLYQQAQQAPLSAVHALSERLATHLSSTDDNPQTDSSELVYAPFTAVRAVKNRHKCVLLAFDALTKIETI